ncbi:peptidoglycan D,D-transpeptidase FtsI family protein [Kutzneria sp. NPDC052558]|uniref:peptidoglycan D,D-transpeptidase FtsI family protein n=1 Tax=Kutzneria sp. NPDC052558 TaxID=3364121 RepID=UPI0037C63539
MPANRTAGGRPATRPRPVVRSGGPAPRPAGRKPRRGAAAGVGNHPRRIVVSRMVMVAVLVIAAVRLVFVQGVQAEELSARAEQQRATQTVQQALRGQILDRNNTQLAFSVETRLLSMNPKQLKASWADPKNLAVYKDLDHGDTYDAYTQGMADFIHQQLGDQVKTADLLTAIRSDKTYVELVKDADPVKATAIIKRYAEIAPSARQLRVYPDGSVGSNLVGYAQWGVDAKTPVGLTGLENSLDDTLKGVNGTTTVDTANGNDDLELPGTIRDSTPAVPGSNVQLTIDADVQYQAQQMLEAYQKQSGAADGSMVVMDAKTGEVYAMAVTNGFNPNKFNEVTSNDQLGNSAVSTPFEPGSVGKVVTAAGAIEYGIEQPDSVIDVPSSFKLADRTVTDAWSHGDVQMTMAGVIAKSSNIGTLEVAQKIGQDRFVDLLTKFGLGQKTGIGLPGESAGSVPPRSTWSGSTFANLPIGQGLSMTLLQMAGMYQAIANDGLRVPPRIIKSVTKADGAVVPTPKPDPVRVVSPQTAKTVRDMMRAVMQKDPKDYLQNGTGYPAALAGYQLSGKTGTAQQPDPALGGKYSQTKYWITFAGILPADNPRLVVGIMLDKPTYGLQAGTSAAPLFHQFGTYLVQHFQIPMSATPSPVVQLQLP